ncbi:hypothetical protein [Comamonas avium]|uniref:Uncharacterized protein n=1 Tax=Comamonas avium TaxID=2762231 RepID=A0ABR8SG23_9BURK|nr:hypothetical protein [Comamonas avium]MBD7962405.1 hypothetical protein [Comamonas avium]
MSPPRLRFTTPAALLLLCVLSIALVVGLFLAVHHKWISPQSFGDPGGFLSGTIGVAASITGTLVSIYVTVLAYKLAHSALLYTYAERYRNAKSDAVAAISALNRTQRNLAHTMQTLDTAVYQLRQKLAPQITLEHIHWHLALPQLKEFLYGAPLVEYTHVELHPLMVEHLQCLNNADVENMHAVYPNYVPKPQANAFLAQYKGTWAPHLDWLAKPTSMQIETWTQILAPLQTGFEQLGNITQELIDCQVLAPLTHPVIDALHAADDYWGHSPFRNLQHHTPDVLGSALYAAETVYYQLLQNTEQVFPKLPLAQQRAVAHLGWLGCLAHLLGGTYTHHSSVYLAAIETAPMAQHLASLYSLVALTPEDLNSTFAPQLINPETDQLETLYNHYAVRSSTHLQQETQRLVIAWQAERSAQLVARSDQEDAPDTKHFARCDLALEFLTSVELDTQAQWYLQTTGSSSSASADHNRELA